MNQHNFTMYKYHSSAVEASRSAGTFVEIKEITCSQRTGEMHNGKIETGKACGLKICAKEKLARRVKQSGHLQLIGSGCIPPEQDNSAALQNNGAMIDRDHVLREIRNVIPPKQRAVQVVADTADSRGEKERDEQGGSKEVEGERWLLFTEPARGFPWLPLRSRGKCSSTTGSIVAVLMPPTRHAVVDEPMNIVEEEANSITKRKTILEKDAIVNPIIPAGGPPHWNQILQRRRLIDLKRLQRSRS